MNKRNLKKLRDGERENTVEKVRYVVSKIKDRLPGTRTRSLRPRLDDVSRLDECIGLPRGPSWYDTFRRDQTKGSLLQIYRKTSLFFVSIRGTGSPTPLCLAGNDSHRVVYSYVEGRPLHGPGH